MTIPDHITLNEYRKVMCDLLDLDYYPSPHGDLVGWMDPPQWLTNLVKGGSTEGEREVISIYPFDLNKTNQ